MEYQDFNGWDHVAVMAGYYVDPATKELLKKRKNIGDRQLKVGGPLLMSVSAKTILEEYLAQRIELDKEKLFSLKQFTLLLGDNSVKKKVAEFLHCQSMTTAEAAWQSFAEYEQANFSVAQREKYYGKSRYKV